MMLSTARMGMPASSARRPSVTTISDVEALDTILEHYLQLLDHYERLQQTTATHLSSVRMSTTAPISVPIAHISDILTPRFLYP
jgi:hypothetical protein